MTTTSKTVKTTAPKTAPAVEEKKVQTAPAVKPAETKVETVQTAPAVKPAETKVETVSKSSIAKTIFEEMFKAAGNKMPVRKDVIARFISQAGLTKAGASTYYFNISQKYKNQVTK